MYTPPGTKNLSELFEQQIRLGLQGYGNTGKTWSALTFPNPIVLNLDRGLGAHLGRKDVLDVRIWDDEYCKQAKLTSKNKKDIIIEWLNKEGSKLEKDQTLVMDGNTGIQNAYHLWFRMNMGNFLSKSGELDYFAEWRNKINFYTEILELIKTFKCNVIWLFHETEKKEKSGDYLGKIRPLLTGQIGDEVETHFTDWFRQHVADKEEALKAIAQPDKLKLWGFSSMDEFKAMCNQFVGNSIYFWQTEGDNTFNAKRSSLVRAPRFIPASYASFMKYSRTKETTTQ